MSVHLEVRPGAYADSVALMLASRAVAEEPGVEHALVAMATPMNLRLLAEAGYEVPRDATPDDLVVAVRAADDDRLHAALGAVAAHLRRRDRAGPDAGARPPRTVGAAARRSPELGGAGVALISVPGRHAVVESVDALDHGLHAMVFSDQVPVAHEIALKDRGEALGLLVMGPDCGTSIIDGVGLGFANVVAPGPVGIVAASGTGAQHLCCLLDDAGIGVRHVLGVGGRDLTAAVGGRSARAALRLLDADPGTELVVVVGKSPHPDVTAALRAAAADTTTPVLLGLIGQQDLTATATAVADALGVDMPTPRTWPAPHPPGHRSGDLRGLFTGGTLCAEAVAIATAALGRLGEDPDADGHVAVDLGEDRYTDGRPHPMIDQSLRAALVRAEGTRPGNHVLLLDVVLGHAAHPDPATELAAAITAARATAAGRGDDLAVVVSLCGSADDPQDRDAQALRLQQAGASVHLSNAAAVRAAVSLLAADGGTP